MNCLAPVKFITIFVIAFFTEYVSAQNQLVEVSNLSSIQLEQGERDNITIPFRIKHRYHIQADTVNDDNLIRTELSIENRHGINPGRPAYPPCKQFKLKGTDDTLLVFDGDLNIEVPIEVSAFTKVGSYPLRGSLFYQACDSVRCLFPRKIDFQVTINVINNK